MDIKNKVVWNLTPYSLVLIYRCIQRHMPEDLNLHINYIPTLLKISPENILSCGIHSRIENRHTWQTGLAFRAVMRRWVYLLENTESWILTQRFVQSTFYAFIVFNFLRLLPFITHRTLITAPDTFRPHLHLPFVTRATISPVFPLLKNTALFRAPFLYTSCSCWFALSS
jgi:hypothetical protein